MKEIHGSGHKHLHANREGREKYKIFSSKEPFLNLGHKRGL